jgi:hypothetical protein
MAVARLNDIPTPTAATVKMLTALSSGKTMLVSASPHNITAVGTSPGALVPGLIMAASQFSKT